MTKRDHYVIIGNGPAGNSAADTLREHDKDARISIISSEPFSYYFKFKLPDFISDDADEQDLLVKPYDVYKQKNIRMRLGQTVDRIDPQEKVLYLKHMEKIGYSKLILATGSSPRIMPSMAAFSEHISTIACYEDVLKHKEKIMRSREFFLLGGDIVCFSMIRTFRKMNKRITVMFFSDAFWPFPLTDELAGTIRENMARQDIDVIFRDRIKNISQEGERISVETEKGISRTTDCVFSFAGMVPNIRFIVGSGIDTDRGILADKHLRTNFKDIYTCGACAQIYNPELKSYWVSVGWHNALIQGKTAALNLLGDQIAVSPAQEKIVAFDGVEVKTSWWKKYNGE